jgi:hypothetical protein
MGILQIKRQMIAWLCHHQFLIEFNKTGKDKLISNSIQIETVGSYCEVNRIILLE